MAAVLLGVFGACTADESPPDEDPVGVALALEVVDGDRAMSPDARDVLLDKVGDALTAYILGGFLGEHPRDEYLDALEAFTSGAAEDAARDLAVVTVSGQEDIEMVVARRLDASIIAFAPAGRLAGASATLDFAFDLTDSEGETTGVTLRGRVALTPEDDAMRIFYFRLQQDDGPVAESTS